MLPSDSKTTDGTLWNTLYTLQCSRKVSVNISEMRSKGKPHLQNIAHSYFAKEELQQFTVHQQLIKSL